MNEMDIQPWLIRMSQGDEEAFQAVYDLTRDQAFGLIYYLAPSKHDVLDIMSEVYIEYCVSNLLPVIIVFIVSIKNYN
ncbi:hypothetical protein OHJ21_09475 [Virgibacillus sp. LDC1]|uniref:hypothetical protein n=1 Tax=Paenibacillus sp. GM2FR TaxID=2059268 RepID=UPI000CBF5E6A|nr:hypothetical protein [Paenibacillus sp. GM2FR]MCV4231397.1 hypothetical protein [Virgibacillus sp. LDC1]PJN55295.1 hypothetical protein PAEVO_20160 [Paenibacillus sp. GM2FR]